MAALMRVEPWVQFPQARSQAQLYLLWGEGGACVGRGRGEGLRREQSGMQTGGSTAMSSTTRKTPAPPNLGPGLVDEVSDQPPLQQLVVIGLRLESLPQVAPVLGKEGRVLHVGVGVNCGVHGGVVVQDHVEALGNEVLDLPQKAVDAQSALSLGEVPAVVGGEMERGRRER